jgi:hypothetical protein
MFLSQGIPRYNGSSSRGFQRSEFGGFGPEARVYSNLRKAGRLLDLATKSRTSLLNQGDGVTHNSCDSQLIQ